MLTAVEFDQTGDYLAAGDRGGTYNVMYMYTYWLYFQNVVHSRTTGCVCIFKTSDKTPELVAKKKTSFWSSSKKKKKKVVDDNLEFHIDFQSHEPEFDYLKSLEIEEKINKIKFCKRSQSALMLLTTNDKTIKLWKVYEKQIKTVSSMKLDTSSTKPSNSTSLFENIALNHRKNMDFVLAIKSFSPSLHTNVLLLLFLLHFFHTIVLTMCNKQQVPLSRRLFRFQKSKLRRLW